MALWILFPQCQICFLGKISFESKFPGRTIQSAGQVFLNEVIFDNENGEWTLLDELHINNVLNLKGGHLITNNFNLGSSGFASISTKTRIFELGASTWNMISPSPITWLASGPTFDLQAGTSLINIETNGITMANSNTSIQFHNMVINAISANINNAVLADVSFNTLDVNAGSEINGHLDIQTLVLHPPNVYQLTHDVGEAFTIGDILANGQCDALITIKSLISGQAVDIISANNQQVEYVIIQDIHISGPGSQVYEALNSSDRGNNDGWLLSSSDSRTLYWVGDAGNWEDISHWSLSSGGPGGECIPTANDDVIFDENSFNVVGEIVTTGNNTIGTCRNMTWQKYTG